jgi:hypothetical protein
MWKDEPKEMKSKKKQSMFCLPQAWVYGQGTICLILQLVQIPTLNAGIMGVVKTTFLPPFW